MSNELSSCIFREDSQEEDSTFSHRATVSRVAISKPSVKDNFFSIYHQYIYSFIDI